MLCELLKNSKTQKLKVSQIEKKIHHSALIVNQRVNDYETSQQSPLLYVFVGHLRG